MKVNGYDNARVVQKMPENASCEDVLRCLIGYQMTGVALLRSVILHPVQDDVRMSPEREKLVRMYLDNLVSRSSSVQWELNTVDRRLVQRLLKRHPYLHYRLTNDPYPCAVCNGTGSYTAHDSVTRTCWRCKGSGTTHHWRLVAGVI